MIQKNVMVCDYCNKESEKLNVIKDTYTGGIFSVCNECEEKVKNNICIVCGRKADILIKGKCNTCYQTHDISNHSNPEIAFEDMTEEEFEQWVVETGKAHSGDDISIEKLRLWIMVKLKVAGILDNKLINKYFKDCENLVLDNADKLQGLMCWLVIVNGDKNIEYYMNKSGYNRVLCNTENVYIIY